MKKSWNPVLNIVAEIKEKYLQWFDVQNKKHQELFGAPYGWYELDLKHWIEVLNDEEINKFFAPLQINQHEYFVLIRYATLFEISEMWEDSNSPYRECRSVVIDLEKMELVSVPFKKFFNIGQVSETMEDVVAEKIKNAKSVEVSDKLDGSMQHGSWYNNRIYLFGSQSLDPNNSWRLQMGYDMLTDNQKDMIKENPHLTFIFEMISPENPHVVQYKEEGLYLIGVRDKRNGNQFSYYNLVDKFSNRYDVPMTTIESKDFEELMEESKTIQAHEKEGWVINVDGELIKIKGEDYVLMHRTLDKIAAPNVIIQSIADGTYDDVITKVPIAYRQKAEKLKNLVATYIINLNEEVMKYYQLAPKTDKRSFMIYVNDNVPQELKAYVRNKYLRNQFNYLKSQTGSYKNLKDLGLTKAYEEIKKER